MPSAKMSKFEELREIKKILEKGIKTIDRWLNNEEIGSRVIYAVNLTLMREDLTKKLKKTNKLLIQIAKRIKKEITDDDDDDDDNMSNASYDNISQEDTSEICNGFNASSATDASEQETYQSSMAGYEQDDTLEEMIADYKAPVTSSNKATVSRRSPAKKPSLESTIRRSERAASKRATEAIRKLFENILQRTRNLKTESTEDDEDWRLGEFAWIKFSERSKNLPGIVLPAMHGIRRARTITLKGVLSLYKFVIYRSKSRIDDKLKDDRYITALAEFNSRNDCKYR
ncbi:uncharacterized protein LOC119082740 isoform X2 [Bradysia coprophila]|uniref:uncharacterized protein LOC119082740 isoform X2 n=1 Tax=Bradysia coprophila TaxID=38358 RepID=UPI00187DB448|nr:uncharacterized protein LOC119082740 isoform X2 [Bradysia coprophila]